MFYLLLQISRNWKERPEYVAIVSIPTLVRTLLTLGDASSWNLSTKIFSWKLNSKVSAESWVKKISSRASRAERFEFFKLDRGNKTKSYQCLDDKEGLCCHTYSCLEFLEEIWCCKCNCICLFACLFIRTPSKKCNYFYFFQIFRNWKGRQGYVETFIIQILVRLSVLPDLNL